MARRSAPPGTALACETLAEQGMQASFVGRFPARREAIGGTTLPRPDATSERERRFPGRTAMHAE